MASDISLEGIGPPLRGDFRSMIYLKVDYNGNIYNWQIYGPIEEMPLGEYLESMKPKIEAEIDLKEAEWAALDPKTKTEFNDANEPYTVPLKKEEVVKPTIPDYYASRRAEYPSMGDQLGAIFKGEGSQDYLNIQERIAAVKAKYPKPPYA